MRRRPSNSLAATVAFAAALVLASGPAAGGVRATEAGLRGGGPDVGVRNGASPAVNEETPDAGKASSSFARTEERALLAMDDNEVSIGPFETNLLATNFPYPLKYDRDNEISGAVTLYLAQYLDDVLDDDADVMNMGLDCSKSKKKIGPETRWVVECEGAATFDGPPPSKRDVDSAVRDAFRGEAEHDFLEIMYSKYELLHEKREWDIESRRRRGGGGRKKGPKNKGKKKGNKNKGGGNKNKGKNKPDKTMQQHSNLPMRPQSKPSSSINIHNVNGSGLNVMGYVSGSQAKPNGKGNVDKNGNIIVRGGGRGRD